MHVMCIAKFPNKCKISGWPMPVPEVGDIDEVVDTITLYGIKTYELQRFGYDNLYGAHGFAILPDTTEEVEAEHQQEALIYQR